VAQGGDMSESKKGYIYVLTNPCIADLVKVGRSVHGGKLRASHIYQTGVPAPFSVYFEMIFDDASAAEKEIHLQLSDYRYSSSREFFRIAPEFAANEIVKEWVKQKGLYLHTEQEALCVSEANCLAEKMGVDPVHIALRLGNVTEEVLFPDLVGKGAQYFYDNLPEVKH
jgi:hypothetical protein